MKQLIATAALLVATTSACEQKPKVDPAPTPTIQPAQPALAANTAPQPPALEPVPVSEDFEEQASVQITADNLDSELAKLEGEINE